MKPWDINQTILMLIHDGGIYMPVVNVDKLKSEIENNVLGMNRIKTSAKKKKYRVDVTTAMGQENTFVGTCPVEMAGKVESKHVVIIQ